MYIALFASLLLTLGAYFLASHHLFAFALLPLACVQAAVQLIFFLHVGQEKKPRWNLLFFGFMLMVVLLVVVCSLWIMYHLNYNMAL